MPGSKADIFAVRDVGFSYPDGTPALANVSFDVGQGERIALLGANGSGKSTLLRLLCALAFPTSGGISAFGLPLSAASMENDDTSMAFRRRVQFVFQDADIQLFSPTVEDEVAFGPLQMSDNVADIRRLVDGALDRLRIPNLRQRAPHRLSGGEKRKVAVASVLVLNPDVLLLDEPTTGLDPRSVGALIDVLDDFTEAGGTVLIATHDLPILPELADRALVFGEDHRLHSDAPVASVLKDRALLERCNLVHIHRHRHDGEVHAHQHSHALETHEHETDL